MPLDLSGFDEEVAKEPKEEKSSKGLDLSGFDQEVSQQPTSQDEKPQLSEALLRKGGQGLTFGLMDEGVAATQAGLDVATSDKKLSDLHSLYQTYKQLQNERENQVAEKYPKVSMAAEIAGSIPTAFTGLGAANTLGKAVKLGGLYGLGKSEADLTSGDPSQLLQGAQDTATGGALGYGGYKVAPLIGKAFQATGIPKLFQSAGQGLKTESNDLALNALGAKAKDIKKERGLSLFSPEGYRKGIGQEAANNLKFTGGPEGIRENVRLQLKDISGQKQELLSNINNQLQSKINPQNASIGTLNEVGENSLANTISKYRDELVQNIKETTPLGKDLQKTVGDNLDEYVREISGNDNNILKLDELRAKIGDKLGNSSFAKDPNSAEALNEQILKKVYFTLKDRIEELSSLVNPKLGQMVRNMNMKQSNLLDLGRIAFNTEAGVAAKGSGWSLGDVMAMGAGAALTPGMPVVGSVAALGAKKGVERVTGFDSAQLVKIAGSKMFSGAGNLASGVGNAMVSPNTIQTGLRSTAETMKPLEMSQKAYTASAEELSGAAQKLMTNPQFQTYGKALQDALSNQDPEKKNAVIFTILQNPKMRSFLNGQ